MFGCIVLMMEFSKFIKHPSLSKVSCFFKKAVQRTWTLGRKERRSWGEQFEALPSVEKSLLLARAHKMNVDPKDKKIQRAAVEDYHSRRKEAAKQAMELDESTSANTTSLGPRPRL